MDVKGMNNSGVVLVLEKIEKILFKVEIEVLVLEWEVKFFFEIRVKNEKEGRIKMGKLWSCLC